MNTGIPVIGVNALAMSRQNPLLGWQTDEQYRFARTDDGGATWTRDETLYNCNALSADPSDGNTVVVSCAGVRRSTDGGRTFTDLVFPAGEALEVLVSPHDSHRIYARSPSALMRTDDLGAHWVDIAPGVTPDFYGLLAAHPTEPDTVFFLDAAGFHRSVNAGMTWTLLLAQPATGFLSALVVNPAHPLQVIAGTSEGVLVSSDGGQTFAPAAPGLPETDVRMLAITTAPAERILAATGQGLFRSSDGGATWANVDGNRVGFALRALVARSSDDLWLGTLSGVQHSADGAVTWTDRSQGMPLTAAALAIAPQAPHTLFANTPVGVYRSTDGAAHWTAEPLFPSDHLVGPITVSGTTPPTVLAAEGDLYRLDATGTSWTPSITMHSNVYTVVTAPSAPEIVYAGVGDYTVARSSDSGATWDFRPLPGIILATGIAVDPLDEDTLVVATTDQLLKSVNGGMDWTPIGTTLDLTGAFLSVAFAPDGSALYAGARLDVFKSTDGGATWTSTGAPQFAANNDLEISPSDPTTVFACGLAGTFRYSTVSGMWRDISLPVGAYCGSLAVDPADPTVVYAGSGAGIFKTTTGGI